MCAFKKWIDVNLVCENEEFIRWFPRLSLFNMHIRRHCETLPNYPTTTVYFGGGKNFLLVVIFVMGKFCYKLS